MGDNVQVAVATEHHLIVAHAVTHAGSDRAQPSGMAARAKEALEADTLDAVADRGDSSREQILACERAGIAVTLPRPMTSGAKAAGRFGKDDFLYRLQDNTDLCPACRTLSYRRTSVEKGLTLHRYWTNVCSMKADRTTGKERRVGGSTRTCGRPCSAGWTATRWPCGSRARWSSTPFAR